MKILRCWCSTPSGDKLFAIYLPFTTKQYKVDNIANFVYYGKTRMNVRIACEKVTWLITRLNPDLIVELWMFVLSYINGVFPKWNGNSVNSRNLINH